MLCRQPPAHFFAEAVPPQKFGNSHAYGMRICPIQADGTDFETEKASSRTSESTSSHEEYVVWRRWDDCLWLQHILETGYASQSREKRRGLTQGRGVKKNGVYVHSDVASSFDSLPFGPDPSSIAKDIHEFIPKLTRKGTLFRASQATVEQRHKQFAALLENLFQDDLPILVKELRNSDIVRRFFGYWRRDKDFELRQNQDTKSRSSRRPGSLHFSPSMLDFRHLTSKHDLVVQTSLPHLSHSPSKRPASESEFSLPKSAPAVFDHIYGIDDHAYPNQPHRSMLPTPHTVREHGSDFQNDPFQVSLDDSPVLGTLTLPGNTDDTNSKTLSSESNTGDGSLPPPVRRAHSSSITDRRNRNCVFFNDTPLQNSSPSESVFDVHDLALDGVVVSSPLLSSPEITNSVLTEVSPRSSRRVSAPNSSSRLSRSPSQSSTSSVWTAPSRTDSPVLPFSPWFAEGEPTNPSRRDSIASMNSVMTDSSVDQILPRSEPNRASFPRLQSLLKKSWPMQAEPTFPEEPWHDDLLGSDPNVTENPPTVTGQGSSEPPRHNQSSDPSGNRSSGQSLSPWKLPLGSPPLTPLSPSSALGGTAASETFAIKALLSEDAIVSFRVPVGVSYGTIRQKIYDKLVNQEGVSMSRSFLVAYLAPELSSSRQSVVSTVRKGGNRLSTVSRIDQAHPMFRYIHSEEEWQEALRHCEGKLALRIFESISP